MFDIPESLILVWRAEFTKTHCTMGLKYVIINELQQRNQVFMSQTWRRHNRPVTTSPALLYTYKHMLRVKSIYHISCISVRSLRSHWWTLKRTHAAAAAVMWMSVRINKSWPCGICIRLLNGLPVIKYFKIRLNARCAEFC